MSKKNRRKQRAARARALAQIKQLTSQDTIAMPQTTNTQQGGENSMNETMMQNADMTTAMKVADQTVVTLALEDLSIEGYQRRTKPHIVKGIISKFNEAKLGLLVVSDRDGIYRLMDGAHRARALRLLNYTHARCLVLHNLTYEQEAEYFASQRENSSALTQFNLFNAEIEANNATSLKIKEIAEKNGFEIRSSNKNFKTISAIHALKTVATEYGFEVLDTTLRLIRETWDGIKQTTNREYIVGVADFVSRFGDPNFAAVMHNKNLKVIWQEYLASTNYSNRSSADPTMRRAFCRALLSQYNSGLRANRRLHMEG